MSLKARIERLEADQYEQEVIIANPWNPAILPTEAEIEAHHARLLRVLKNPKAIIIIRCPADGSDPWRVRPLLAAHPRREVVIKRS